MRNAVDFPHPDGTEQRDELARPHVEIEPGERAHAVGKRLADATQRDEGCAMKCCRRRHRYRYCFGRRSSPTFLSTNCSV